MEATGLTPSLRETLDVFEAAGGTCEPLTTNEVTEHVDVGRRSTYERLERLVDQRRLRTKKVGARGRIWWRPPTPQRAGTGDSTAEEPVRSDAVFRALVDAVEEYAIFQLDPDGRIQTWNPGAEKIKGYGSDEILGEHFSTFYTDDDRAAGVPERNLEAAIEHGDTEDEGWRVRADGSTFWANVTITAIRDDDGDLQGFAKVTREMTERHEYERELRRQRDFTREVLETSPVGVIVIQPDGTFETANRRAEELLGLDTDDRHSVGINEVYDEDGEYLPPERRPYVRVFETGESVRNVHLAIPTGDGGRRWISTNIEPVHADDGSVERALITLEDVTQLKEQARQLERSRDELERELDEVFERIDDAFFAVDTDWRFTYVNEAAAELVGLSVEEMAGARVGDTLPEVAEGYPRAMAERSMETGESAEVEFYSELLDRWVEAQLYPDEHGLSVYFRDVTGRVERERELEESRRRLQTLVEHFPNGAVALVDESLQYVTVGGTPLRTAGRTRDELEGRSLSDVLPEELYDLVGPRYEEALEGDPSSFEHDFGESVVQFRIVPVRDDDGRVFAAMGMSQDVTERKQQERELERRLRQQQVVADLGHDALETHDLDALMHEAARLVADVLDNHYCKVLDLDETGERLLLRQGVGWDEGIVGEGTVSATENDSQAAYTLSVDEPVVVEDLETETRFSGPDLLTDHGVRSGISVTIGPRDDPWGILGTHDEAPKEIGKDDVNLVQAVANILASAIDRHQYEAEILQQRAQLEALNSLNEVVHDITDAVVDQSTRAEIEHAVVEGLADADSFAFAWIGEVDRTTREVTLRTEAGVEGYLDDVTITVDPDDERSRGPTGRALSTGEMQVARDAKTGTQHGPWRDHVTAHNFRSSAAVPIVHEDTIYGVLNVYARRPDAFKHTERQVLAQLGEVVGHAIAALERKQALMSDEVVELEFTISDLLGEFGIDAGESQVTLSQAVPSSDGAYLLYGSATDAGRAVLDEIVATFPHWESVRDTSTHGGRHRFEARLTEPPVLSVVASLGGYVDEAVIEDGDFHLTVHLPPTVDTQSVSAAVIDEYPMADLVAKRQFSRTDTTGRRLERLLHEDLTERQRAAVEAAYHAGYFEWPRESDGEAVAEALGVSSPTFHQHLRKAEQKLFETLLVGSNASDEVATG